MDSKNTAFEPGHYLAEAQTKRHIRPLQALECLGIAALLSGSDRGFLLEIYLSRALVYASLGQWKEAHADVAGITWLEEVAAGVDACYTDAAAPAIVSNDRAAVEYAVHRSFHDPASKRSQDFMFRLLSIAIHLDPTHRSYWHLFASCYRERDPYLAVDAFSRSLSDDSPLHDCIQFINFARGSAPRPTDLGRLVEFVQGGRPLQSLLAQRRGNYRLASKLSPFNDPLLYLASKPPQTPLFRACVSVRESKWEDAMKLCEQAMAQGDRFLRSLALCVRAVVWMNFKAHERALSDFNACGLENDAWIYLYKGRIYLAMKDFRWAANCFGVASLLGSDEAKTSWLPSISERLNRPLREL